MRHGSRVQGHHTRARGRHASIKQARQRMGDEEKKTLSPLTEELEANTVACIKTRLLLGVAKDKESKTKGESNMTGKH